jgi:hypothetical protein
VNIPWEENATLVRVVGLPEASGESAAILFEGTLHRGQGDGANGAVRIALVAL